MFELSASLIDLKKSVVYRQNVIFFIKHCLEHVFCYKLENSTNLNIVLML